MDLLPRLPYGADLTVYATDMLLGANDVTMSRCTSLTCMPCVPPCATTCLCVPCATVCRHVLPRASVYRVPPCAAMCYHVPLCTVCHRVPPCATTCLCVPCATVCRHVLPRASVYRVPPCMCAPLHGRVYATGGLLPKHDRSGATFECSASNEPPSSVPS
jgi:hypothetical protein